MAYCIFVVFYQLFQVCGRRAQENIQVKLICTYIFQALRIFTKKSCFETTIILPLLPPLYIIKFFTPLLICALHIMQHTKLELNRYHMIPSLGRSSETCSLFSIRFLKLRRTLLRKLNDVSLGTHLASRAWKTKEI